MEMSEYLEIMSDLEDKFLPPEYDYSWQEKESDNEVHGGNDD